MRLPTAMENHTPEPWVKKGSTVISPSRGGLTVEEYDEQTWTYYGGYLIAESITDANARRIVACVNACAGCGLTPFSSLLHSVRGICFILLHFCHTTEEENRFFSALFRRKKSLFQKRVS